MTGRLIPMIRPPRVAALLILSAACLLCMTGCGEQSKSALVPSTRLTPEEAGNLELLKPNIDAVVNQYAKANIALQQYRKHTGENNAALAQEQSRQYFNALFRLKQHLLDMKEPPPGPPLIVPTSLQEVVNALVRFEALRHQVSSGPVTDGDQTTIYTLAGELYFADKALADALNARVADYSGTNVGTNFAAELGFIKVDFAKGEVKVRHSWQTGPLKWSVGAGPERGGIRTLIIQNAQGHRVFAVGGKAIEVYVEQSVIRTNGSVMTVTAVEGY